MRAITETELRDMYKKTEFTTFNLPEGARLTPAAAQFLSERRIQVLNGSRQRSPKDPGQVVRAGGKKELFSAADFNGQKPEHMTHLTGSTLVLKSHPRIKFRGKLDTFEAQLISAVIEVESLGQQEMSRDLEKVLEYVRLIMRAEVKEEPLEAINFHGWPPDEIRERSHYPQKYFGVNHILPNPGQGVLMAKLNFLRTQVRELELVAIEAFCPIPEKVEREDIIQSLNRLSSLLYIMMVQLVSGHYRIGC